MREAVDEVIALRAQDPQGLRRMITWSFAVHVGVLVLIAVVPRAFSPAAKPPVMVISLGGTPGPRSTGMTPVSARPVEEVTPEPKRQTPIPVAAPKPDVMTVPTKPPVKPPKPETKPSTTPLPSPAVTKPPATGRQIQTGTSAVETGARGVGAGLTVGGGGDGAQLKVDSDFCCPAYLQDVVSSISRVWRSVQPEHGTTVLKFTIQRDGKITDIEAETSSGSSLLDRLSRATLMDPALRLPPLPAEYTNDHLTIHLSFPYRGPEQ
ncbi:MAG TPA: TonB C-terminal domain-containing protein [Vicinamibacterales bacterium]|nr:TonB C-terminal domain-containing protein [Vicinamibacterales bacterium]